MTACATTPDRSRHPSSRALRAPSPRRGPSGQTLALRQQPLDGRWYGGRACRGRLGQRVIAAGRVGVRERQCQDDPHDHGERLRTAPPTNYRNAPLGEVPPRRRVSCAAHDGLARNVAAEHEVREATDSSQNRP